MNQDSKCPYCGNNEFYFDDRLLSDLDIRSYDDDGTSMSFFGINPLNGYTLMVCSSCGHASLFKNDSDFVREKKLSLIMPRIEPLVKEIRECEKEIKALDEKKKATRADSQLYKDIENRIKKVDNRMRNIKRELSNILADAHVSLSGPKDE